MKRFGFFIERRISQKLKCMNDVGVKSSGSVTFVAVYWVVMVAVFT